MKLLLDEMWSPDIAVQLRRHGHDVDGVAARVDFRTQPDPVVWAVAQHEARVIVTENVPDFRQMTLEYHSQGRVHAGLIFTNNRRYPRHDRRTAGRLVTALLALLASTAVMTGREHWLD